MAIKYARLFSPTCQFQTRSGALNTAGLLRVFINNTDDLAQVYNDNMELMRQPIVLDDNGRAQGVFVDIKKVYRLEVYDRSDSLLFTIPNLQATEAAGGSTIINPTALQHWLGMYGPTYVHFPGDNAGHTLGLPSNEIEYVGDFIDHISTCPYPDSTPPGYIYLKPGLYFVSCIIRYQQDPEALSNTLDEVLVYTGHGNANESLAYQMDSSGPETTGNRHNVRVQFIRKVPEDAETEILYFAPGTPIDWKEAYIQRLEIVKLDGIKGEPGEQGPKGDTGPQGPQGEIPFTVPFVAGEGVTMELDSDGEQLQVVISAEGRKYQAGSGIEIDSDGVISVDSDSLPTGPTGADGKSAYEIWIEQGHTGTEEDFLNSLVGATGSTGAQGPAGEDGTNGADGKSAYDIWLENGHTGSEADFLESLVGATGATGQQGIQGQTGADGKSSYEIWLEQGNTGSEQDFLNSLVGATGATGMTGATGPMGMTGATGPSVQTDWDATDSDGLDYLKNKPKPKTLTAGQNINISETASSITISATGGQSYSAGNGININNGEISVDETVLWEGTCALSGTISLSEAASNFERIKVYWCGEDDWSKLRLVNEFKVISNTRSICALSLTQRYEDGKWNFGGFELTYDSNNDRYTMTHNCRYNMNSSGIIDISNDSNNFVYIYKIVGINRIASNQE